MFQKPVRTARRLTALLALVTALPSVASAATPALIWRDVSSIGVQCIVHPGDAAGRALQASLCDQVSRLAAPGAPAPVTVIMPGDPRILAPGAVTLLVHASIAPAADGRLVAFSVRPFRVSAEQASVLFGAAPRAATIPDSGAGSPALDAALSAALSETLPWLAKPEGARPLD